MVTMREQMARTITDLFRDDPRVAIILAEISTQYFDEAFAHDPARAVNVGIMEQTMIGVAAGFAMEGFLPFAHTIAPFLAERALEQIKLDFGYQDLQGTFATVGASYDYTPEGFTHHAPADVQEMLAIPRMEVVVPGTAGELDVLLRATYADGHPTYLRTTSRENATSREVELGRLDVVRRGADATVVVVGPMLDRTLAAVEGIDVTLLYATTVSPFDAVGLAREAADAPEVIDVIPFLEGTLTPALATALAHRPARFASIGVSREVLRRYGTPEDHDRARGLDAAGIRERIGAFIGG
ncbi:MAG: transketolase family protein [Actinomycetota bacterium]